MNPNTKSLNHRLLRNLSDKLRETCRTCSSTGLHFQCAYLLRYQPSFKTSNRGHVFSSLWCFSLHHDSHQRGSVFSSSLPYALFGSDDSETCIIYYSRHLVCACYFVMSEDSLEKKSSFPCHRCRLHCYLPLYFNLFVYQNLSTCKASQVGYSITTRGHTKVEC